MCTYYQFISYTSFDDKFIVLVLIDVWINWLIVWYNQFSSFKREEMVEIYDNFY